MRIAIIGSAGRQSDAPYVTPELWHKMCQRLIIELLTIIPSETVDLVSGGAAFADHVAVWTYLQPGIASSLTLHLPSLWAATPHHPRFTGNMDGHTANSYHQVFSQRVFNDPHKSLQDIQLAIDKGATIHTHQGFGHRNYALANDNLDAAVAFTFGHAHNPHIPKPGGTRHTWDMMPSTTQKIHINLNDLL